MTDVPDGIKIDCWRLFEQAESPDPAYAAQYSIKWCVHLRMIMKISGIKEYDALLVQALEKARISLASYTDIMDTQHEGKALQEVSEVIDQIGFLMYDDRFAIREKTAFTTIGFVNRE